MLVSDSVIVTLLLFFVVILLLFLWLLYDSRKEAREDKARARDREDKLVATLQAHMTGYGELVGVVRSMQTEMKEMNNALSLLVTQRGSRT